MKLTRYKPFFSINASYVLPGIGVSTQGISVNAVDISDAKMYDLKLKPKYKENTATVFYEGTETPPGVPLTSEPAFEIVTDEYFYFGVNLSDKEKIKKLKFYSAPAVEKEIGFPLLYDASVKVLNGPAVLSPREDVKVVLPLFTFTALAADTGITAGYASLEIRDEKNVIADLGILPVQLNDKKIDGLTAKPAFAFSVDASRLEAGIYTFKVGNFSKKYFIANKIDVSNVVSLVRVLKNNFLQYKKSLADKTFTLFELQIPSA